MQCVDNWVGSGGRIILGYLAAVAFFGVGDILRRRSGAAAFGLYLTGGALTTFYLTTQAACELYAFLSQASAALPAPLRPVSDPWR
jgi:uncharacterized membrane protein